MREGRLHGCTPPSGLAWRTSGPGRFLEAKYPKSLDKVDESVDALLRGEEEKSRREPGTGWGGGHSRAGHCSRLKGGDRLYWPWTGRL